MVCLLTISDFDSIKRQKAWEKSLFPMRSGDELPAALPGDGCPMLRRNGADCRVLK
jgi:hypothetical protein